MKFLIFSVLVLAGSLKSTFGLCVSEEKANLRRGPGVHWTKTWEAIRYTPLEKLGKKNGWYRVKDIDGIIHWVKEDLVTRSYSCAAVKNSFANLRTGPGLQFPKAPFEKADKYVSFRVLKSKGRWIKLEDIEGDEVWAARENLWIQ